MFREEGGEGGQWKSGDERGWKIAKILMPVRVRFGTLVCRSSLPLERRPNSTSVDFGCTEPVLASVVEDVCNCKNVLNTMKSDGSGTLPELKPNTGKFCPVWFPFYDHDDFYLGVRHLSGIGNLF